MFIHFCCWMTCHHSLDRSLQKRHKTRMNMILLQACFSNEPGLVKYRCVSQCTCSWMTIANSFKQFIWEWDEAEKTDWVSKQKSESVCGPLTEERLRSRTVVNCCAKHVRWALFPGSTLCLPVISSVWFITSVHKQQIQYSSTNEAPFIIMTKRINFIHSDASGLIFYFSHVSQVIFSCCDLVVVGRSMLENQTSPPCQLLKDPLAPHLRHASAEGIYVKLFHRAKMTAYLEGQGVRPVAMDFISCGKVLQFHTAYFCFTPSNHGTLTRLCMFSVHRWE